MIVDSRTRLDEQTLADEGMSPGESAMHTHYASNALAQGHAETCARVTTPRNWPTMLGRPDCTCGHSRPEVAPPAEEAAWYKARGADWRAS